MENKWKCAMLVVVLGLSAFAFLNVGVIRHYYLVASEGMSFQDSTADWNGLACASLERTNGVTEDLGCHHNLIVNNGKDMAIGDLFGLTAQGTNNVWNQLALGQNVTPMAATDTALSGIYTNCGLGVATSTLTRVAVGNVSSVYTWTSTCDSKTITAVAMYNATNNILAAEAVVTSAILNIGDKLTLTYYGAQT
jgi:galactitol-specific phosphotransferase system IIB component